MYAVIVFVHIVTCLFLISVVLLQQGKGADMGAVFGGSSSTIFGSSGAGNFLSRLTTVMAVVFMLTSLTLTYTGARRLSSTVFDAAPLPEPPPLEAPANSGAGAAPQAGAPAGEPAAAPGAEPQAAAPAGAPAAAPAAEPQAAAPEAAPPPEQKPAAAD